MPKATRHRNPEREKDVLKLNSEGKSIAEIAEKLDISTGTAGYYLYKNKIYKNGGKKHTNGVKHSNGKTNSHHAKKEDTDLQIKQAFLTGTIVGELRGYATSHQISFASLALGVAEGLRAF